MLLVKLFSICVLMMVLSGCVSFYDPFEYRKYIEIIVLAEEGKCTPAHVEKMIQESRFLYFYTYYTPFNEQSANASQKIYLAIRELDERVKGGPVSPKYCKLKLEGISFMAQLFADAVRKKPLDWRQAPNE